MVINDFDWSKDVTFFDEQLKSDEFGRSKYASYLTGLLMKKSLKGNYVLNLNSEWGSGKTYFIKRWAKELKSTHPVVYIDAWQQDYSDDPLLTVISSIVGQLKEQAGPDFDKMTQKVFGKIVGLLKATAPAITGAIVKKSIGVDIDELSKILKGEDSSVTVVDSQGKTVDLSNAASAMVSYIIKEHEAKGASIKALKAAINEWIVAIIGKGNGKVRPPAFIFIDELDRCRPSYAVEMLETIKHLFSIPQAVFVIATDTEQLQHAIKVIYGDEFEAGTYLGRFFNARYALARPEFKSYFNSVYSAEINEYSFIDSLFCCEKISVLDNLSMIAGAFFKSIRDVNKVMERFLIVVEQVSKIDLFNIYYAFILLCLFEKRHADFNEILSKHFVTGNGSVNHSWFEQFSGVKWNREICLFVDAKVLSKLVLPKASLINRYADSGMYQISISSFFRIVHDIFIRPDNKSYLLGAEKEKIINKFGYNGLLVGGQSGRLEVSEYVDSYIKLLVISSIDSGYEYTEYLDWANMSHSFESLS